MKDLSCSRYFVQSTEKSLDTLMQDQQGFIHLEDAKAFIAQDDPEERFAYTIYKVEITEVYSV